MVVHVTAFRWLVVGDGSAIATKDVCGQSDSTLASYEITYMRRAGRRPASGKTNKREERERERYIYTYTYTYTYIYMLMLTGA